MRAVARVLVLWTRPYHLSAEEAESWARGQASRLLSLDVIERAELTHLQNASRHHPREWDWMLELHLTEDAERHSCADRGPCAEWLADLRQLGLRPTVLVADAGLAVHAETR